MSFLDSSSRLERAVRLRCVKNFLEPIILLLVKSKPMSGYDIMTFVYERLGVLLSPGTVYPVLASLERKEESVRVEQDGREEPEKGSARLQPI